MIGRCCASWSIYRIKNCQLGFARILSDRIPPCTSAVSVGRGRMRTQFKLCLLLSLLVACSGTDSVPTETKPELAVMCSPPRATVSSSPIIPRIRDRNYSTSFTVGNNCSVGLSLNLTGSRTGAVTRVGTPNPSTMTLAAGASKPVVLSYHTGAPGSGTVVLTATTKAGTASWGVLYVNVTN
jgi:hypothetical protein